VVWSSRSCSWHDVPASIRTWWTVRLVGADSPRGASWPGVLRVRRVFLSAFILIGLASCFWPEGVWRTARLGVADRPRGTSCSRTVRGPGVDRPLFEVRFWRFCCVFQTVRSRVADSPPGARGPSALVSRTVFLGFRRVAKSFASLVSLLLWDCLGFVPRVGRSVVTTRPC
jgi:hypothetical protein